MIFGAISYLNLLPFQVFMKKYISHSGSKMTLNYKKNIPSQINKALKNRKIDAGFISSIKSKKCKCTNLGIISYKEVYSVLLLEGKEEKDPASATSNSLAKVLNLKGKVLIGDEALKYYLEGKNAIDLSRVWFDKYNLPFVFARLCYIKNDKYIETLAKAFIHKNIKIPQYILKKEAKKREISVKDLQCYLKHISYNLDYKSKKALRLFLRLSS